MGRSLNRVKIETLVLNEIDPFLTYTFLNKNMTK